MEEFRVSGWGCIGKNFKCQMCRPYAAEHNYLIKERCRLCAQSKKAKGLIAYYWQKKYDWDLEKGEKVLISSTLIERWADDSLHTLQTMES